MITVSATPPLTVELSVTRVEVTAGQTVQLWLRLTAERPLTVRGATVELSTRLTYLHKEGGLYAGRSIARARRTEVRATQEVPGPWPIQPGELITLPVAVQVPPDAPGTTHVPVVEITWWVTARVRVADFAPAEVSRSFVVLSRAADLLGVAFEPVTGNDRRCARVSIEDLPSRFLAPGCALSGTVAIRPLRRCAIRGVRLELAVRQKVHHGEWTGDDPTRNPAYQELEQDLVVAGSRLSGPTVLEPADPVRTPFRLILPEDLPAASLVTPNFTLSWLLRAVVDRRLRPDPYVEVPLHARTTRD